MRTAFQPFRLTWAAILIGGVALATALLRGWLPFIYAPSYRPETMTEIPAQRTTHCIGRYLIDLPVNFELRTGGWGEIELYYGLDKNFQRVYATVQPGRYTREAFWQEVNKRRFALRDEQNRDTKESMLLFGQQLDDSSALIRSLESDIYDGSVRSEVHQLVGPRYVVLEQVTNDSISPLGEKTHKKVDSDFTEDRLKMIASKLMYYETAERAKPGFCMQGVIFDVGQDDETTIFRFRAKNLPDLLLNVDYHAVTGQPRLGILERRRDAYRLRPIFYSVIATLREGQTSLGGVSAEESLTKSVRPITQHFFDIERRTEEKRSLEQPFFGLKLTTGNEYREPLHGRPPPPDTESLWYSRSDDSMVHRRGNASLSDDQVLKLWDGIVASVRKR